MEKKKRKKRHYKINVKKKIIVLVVLGTFLFVGLGFSALGLQFDMDGTLEVGKYDKTLYGAIRKDVKNGYAIKYLGEHQDSMDSTQSTSDIYSYHLNNSSDYYKINTRNNVVFADICWQMYRTTDTGGVKMIYNGIADIKEESGQTQYICDSTRPYSNIGKIKRTIDLSGTKKYAKNYTTNSSSNKHTLVDDLNDPDDAVTIQIDSTNAEEQIEYIKENYPYTCNNTTGSCNIKDLYKIDSYNDSTIAYAYQSSYKEFIGSNSYNSIQGALSDVGYMYGEKYNKGSSSLYIGSTQGLSTYTRITDSKYSIDNTYFYADSYDWNVTNVNNYTLINPTQVTNETDLDSLIGKYIIKNSTISNKVYYVIGNNGSNKYYVKLLYNGNSDVSIRFSDSLTTTGELDNPTELIELKTYYTNYENYKYKYTCGDSSTSCTTPRYIINTNKTTFTYMDGEITISKTRNGLELVDPITISALDWYKYYDTTYKDYKYTCGNSSTVCSEENLRYIYKKDATYYGYIYNHYYGKSVKYENGKYKLQNVGGIETAYDLEALSTHHYTCFEKGKDECNTLAYIYNFDPENSSTMIMDYILIDNPEVTSINQAIENMLDKNTNDSIIKKDIDEWYENSLKDTPYEEKLEDTIYCNDRSLATTPGYSYEESGWNDNGGYTNKQLYFNVYNSNISNLSCKDEEDRFSTSNNKAKLKYKIGLISSPEINLIYNHNTVAGSIFDRNSGYFTMTPSFYHKFGIAEVNYIDNVSFEYSTTSVTNTNGIRPVISLVKGTEYESGTGTKKDPYIVNMNK